MLKVYDYLMSQSGVASGKEISKRTGLSTKTVYYHLQKLREGDYIEEILPETRPKSYRRGRNANILDSLITSKKNKVYKLNSKASSKLNTRGVSPSSPENLPPDSELSDDPSTKIEPPITGTMHHVAYTCNVVSVGDIHQVKWGKNAKPVDFLTQNAEGLKGIESYSGKVPIDGEEATVRYLIGKNKEILMIWPPPFSFTSDMTKDEVLNKTRELAQRISNKIQKFAKWQLGFLERTDWKWHLAIEDDNLTRGLPQEGVVFSQSGKTFFSNSEGKSELEVQVNPDSDYDWELIRTLVDLPETVLKNKMVLESIQQESVEFHEAIREELETFRQIIRDYKEIYQELMELEQEKLRFQQLRIRRELSRDVEDSTSRPERLEDIGYR